VTPKPAPLRVLLGGKAGASVATPSSASGPASAPAPSPGAELPVPTSFDALYVRYAPYVAAIAARILGRDDELDDLVQDTFVNALRGASGLREPAAVKGWLATIAVRLSTRRLRVRRLRTALHLERDVRDVDIPCADDTSAEQRATLVRVYRALDRLPAAERVAWVLRHVQGEPLRRLPELCECSLSTAQRRLARAQAALDQELGHE
jgi:RNA polymerase sigma-70 factor (ECF subfamily)